MKASWRWWYRWPILTWTMWGLRRTMGPPDEAQDLLLRGVMNHWNSMNLARRGDSLYQPLFKTDQTEHGFSRVRTRSLERSRPQSTMRAGRWLRSRAVRTVDSGQWYDRVRKTGQASAKHARIEEFQCTILIAHCFLSAMVSLMSRIRWRSVATTWLSLACRRPTILTWTLVTCSAWELLESLETPAFDTFCRLRVFTLNGPVRIFCAVCIGRMCFDINTPESTTGRLCRWLWDGQEVEEHAVWRGDLQDIRIWTVWNNTDKITTAYMGYAFENISMGVFWGHGTVHMEPVSVPADCLWWNVCIRAKIPRP